MTRLRHGAAGSTRSIATPGRLNPRQLRLPRGRAAGGRSSARSRRARGTAVRRRPRSSNPWPSVRVGRVPPAERQTRRSPRPSRDVVPGRRRHANPASNNRRRASADPRISGPIGTAGSTASSRSSPTERTRPTEPMGPTDRMDPAERTDRATAATTRSRGCGIAARRMAISVRRTGPGRRLPSPSIRPMPGSTTSKRS